MAVITISRQFGSGGDQIATYLCNKLNYKYFDKGLMAQLATEANLSLGELVDFSEEKYKVRGLLERLLDTWTGPRVITQVGTWTQTSKGSTVREVMKLDEEQSIAFTQSSILAAHRLGRVVIVGRGGQAILKDMPDVLHVRIEASLSFRISHLQKPDNLLSLAQARELIAQHDRTAKAYLKRFYNIEWDDSTNYHLVINTGYWNLEAAAKLIIEAVNQLQPAGKMAV